MRYFISILWLGLLAEFVGAAPIQFLVAELPQYRRHDDSFVITIDSDDVGRLNHARALLGWVDSGAEATDSPGATIVLANLIAGSDGINRNALAPGEPLWSWHTAAPIEFVDLTIEILDGTPTMVEQDFSAWVANTGGAIGFWSYSVVAEIGAVPEPSTIPFMVMLVPCLMRSRRRRLSQSSGDATVIGDPG